MTMLPPHENWPRQPEEIHMEWPSQPKLLPSSHGFRDVARMRFTVQALPSAPAAEEGKADDMMPDEKKETEASQTVNGGYIYTRGKVRPTVSFHPHGSSDP